MLAALRPARLALTDETSATARFLTVDELDSVLASFKAVEVDLRDLRSKYSDDEVKDTSSKNLHAMIERVVSKQPKRVFLSSTTGGDRYRMLAKYDGFIVSRDSDSFVARFYENGSDYPVMEAEFGIEDISLNERVLAISGAPLVWTISYRHEGGTVFRDSRIYMRRLEWNSEDIATALETAKALTDGLIWEPDAPA
jgi:hypothetical protein